MNKTPKEAAALKHPIQPLQLDDKGVLRFKPNAIVQHLLDNGQIDLNQLAVLPFSNEDREQFAQLIGYSLSGYGELSYVSDATYVAAENINRAGQTEDHARIADLEAKLEVVRSGLKKIVPAIFRIHPDDLTV